MSIEIKDKGNLERIGWHIEELCQGLDLDWEHRKHEQL